MSDIIFDVPNLDGQSIDPEDYERLAMTLQILADYSRNKAMAMRYRESGSIQAAMRIEDHNDEVYARLPDWARW